MPLLLAFLLFLPHDKSWPVPKEASEKKNPVKATAASLKQAKALYEDNCMVCHGEKGNGKGAGAAALRVVPSNFTDSHMMKEMTDGEIFYKMSEGRAPMTAFKGRLTEEQRWGLVNYLRQFAKRSPAKKK